MYRDKLIYGLMAVSAFFAACSDDFGDTTGPKNPIVDGDEILFGATDLATFDDGFTDGVKEGRTVYGDANYSGGAWHYPLNWVVGDEVSIYSPDATFPNQAEGYADYVIAGVDEEGNAVGDGATISDNTNAYLKRVGDNGLHWNGLDKTYKFYAFYPSKVIKEDEDGFNKGVVHGEIPKNQKMVKWETRGNVKVGIPDMDLALMRGYAEVNPSTLNGKAVNLKFSPLTTAIEVTLVADKDLVETNLMQAHIRAIDTLSKSTQPICGKYQYNIDEDVTESLDHTIYANSHEITVDLWDGVNPLTIKGGESIRFTVFLLPGKNEDGTRTLKNLQIEIPGWNGGTSVKTYPAVNIEKGTKSQIVLPKYSPTGSVNNWMSRIPDNTYVSQLTIPGATDALSKGKPSSTQNLDLVGLFNAGVRAFEFATNNDLSYVTCGDNESTGTSFIDALKTLKSLLDANPSEFVVVTTYYLKSGGSYDSWVQNLVNLESDLTKLNCKPFSNGLVIGSKDDPDAVRGKILLMARTNGSGQESAENLANLAKIMPVIHGWHNQKDKWDRRGYDTQNSSYFEDINSDRKHQWSGSNSDQNPLLSKVAYKGSTLENWKYNDEGNPNPNLSIYVQEWKRVCKETDWYYHMSLEPPIFGGYGYKTYWEESKTEKIRNVTEFFTWTKDVLKNAKDGSSLFINHLGGYYITSGGTDDSAAPNSRIWGSYGRTGDVVSYSKDINTEIYKHMLGVAYENRGPVGVVYFNFAGVEEYSGIMHGDYLLKTLIGNNFSFPLLGK